MILALNKTWRSLQELNDFCLKERPDRVIVNADGTFYPKSCVWTYTAPGGVDIIGGVWDGKGQDGWFLSYQPDNPTGTQGKFTIKNATIKNWQRGGIEISPSVNGDPFAAGILTWLSSAEVTNCKFINLGNKKPSKWAEQKYGVAGILARGTRSLKVTKSVFTNLVNVNLVDNRFGPGMIHAVYAREETEATVSDCSFKTISGDPIRVSNGAEVTVSNCRAFRAGERAFASDWHTPEQARSVVRLDNNKITTLFNNKKSPQYWTVDG